MFIFRLPLPLLLFLTNPLSSPLAHAADYSIRADRNTLIVCDDIREPLTLDPQKEFVEKTDTILHQIYDGLVRFSPKGEIQPALAVSWQRLGPTIMEFKLRQGVLFHNGEVFNAESVKFSIDRYLDPKTGFPALGFIQSLKGVSIIDPHTVHIVTHYSDNLLLNRLAGFIVIVPRNYVRQKGEDILQRYPVGTGAFRFVAWKKDQEIELEANPNYWEAGAPKINSLIFRFLPQKDQVSHLLAGELDVVTDVPGTETLKIQKSKTAKIVKCPSLSTVAASFNSNSIPLNNLKVRQALNYAIDKSHLIRYILLGNGRSTNNLVLPEHSVNLGDEPLKSYNYDPNKAIQLLREAGYANNLKLRVIEVKATRAAKIIAAHWKRIGVLADITSSTDAKIGEELKTNNWDIFLGYCPDPMYHPFFIHSIFLYSKSPYSLTKDPQLDRLIDALEQETDLDQSERRIKKLASYVNQNALSLFTFQQIKTYGVRRNLHFEPYMSGMPLFHTAAFEKEKLD